MQLSEFSIHAQNKIIYDRAINYPYKQPDESFVYYNEKYYKIQNFFSDEPIIFIDNKKHDLLKLLKTIGYDYDKIKNRTQILSYGSNSSHGQLIRKFKSLNDVLFPVINIKLKNFDTIYTSFITSYGAHPATIINSENTYLYGTICYFDDKLLKIMDKTEGRGKTYELVEILDSINPIEINKNNEINSIKLEQSLKTYLSNKGALNFNNEYVAIKEIKNQNRHYNAMLQHEVMLHTLNYFKSFEKINIGNQCFNNLNNFILSNIQDPNLRKERNMILNTNKLDYQFNCKIL